MTQTCCCLIRFEWQNNFSLCDLLLEFYVMVLFAVLGKMEFGIYISFKRDRLLELYWHVRNVVLQVCITSLGQPFTKLYSYCIWSDLKILH